MLRLDLVQRLRQRLGADGTVALDRLMGLTEAQKTPLLVVGGSVRDLLLNYPSLDVDLVVEGDAVALAQALAAAVGARCVVHRQFGTASVQGRGFALDLATARCETYPRPGALPVVRPGNLAQDLARRDFTINAMALALAVRPQGELIDPYDGRGDIARRFIRALHDASFVDDATRILRAIRYEARLRFEMEPHTLSLLRRDMGYLATVNAARLRLEFQRILMEEAPEAALLRCQELNVLTAIHPTLSYNDDLAQAFRQARREASSSATVYLGLLALALSPTEAVALARRLTIGKAQRQAMEAMPEVLAVVGQWGADVRPSQVVRALQPYPEASLWAVTLAARRACARDLARRYLETWRHVRPALDGHALRRLGVPQGPKMGEVIEQLQEARLDGRLRTRDEEVRLVREMVGDASATA